MIIGPLWFFLIFPWEIIKAIFRGGAGRDSLLIGDCLRAGVVMLFDRLF